MRMVPPVRTCAKTPPPRWIGVGVELRHQPVPGVAVDDGDLAPAAAIDVPDQASPFFELRFSDWIHRAAMGPFDPDGLERGVLDRTGFVVLKAQTFIIS